MFQGFIGPEQLDGFPDVIQFAQVRAQDRDISWDLVFLPKRVGIGFRDDQSALSGNPLVGGEIEFNPASYLPGVLRETKIKQRQIPVGAVSEFDELVVVDGRMIHDTSHHDWPGVGFRVRGSFALQEQGKRFRRIGVPQVGSECLVAQGANGVRSIGVTSHGSTVFGCREFHRIHEGNNVSVCVGLSQMHGFAECGTQGKWNARVIGQECCFIDDLETIRGNHGAWWYLVFLKGLFVIA